jgi:uroporphyrin-III C-methyltransferase
MTASTGKVTFVSAGPGDPELLTVKAVKRIEAADAILFDDLAAGPILGHARPDADLVGTGKRAGRVSPRQDHVNQLLIDYAKGCAEVVRLKSGDASLFGRLEEEIKAVNRAGIPFEIIPGVTAPAAAAAAAGIPLSRRLTARRVQFITGHDTTGDLPNDLNIAALADPTAMTAVYMGKRTFGRLARRLLDAGLASSTPVLIAESVSTQSGHNVRTTLEEVEKTLELEIGDGPAIILYGPLMNGDEA